MHAAVRLVLQVCNTVMLTIYCVNAILRCFRYPYFARWAETVAVKAVAHMNEQAVAGAVAASNRKAAATNDTVNTTSGSATGAAAAGVVMCLHVRRGDKLNLPK
jgi:hypothetical protein